MDAACEVDGCAIAVSFAGVCGVADCADESGAFAVFACAFCVFDVSVFGF